MLNEVKATKLKEDALIPTRKNPTDAGMDFYAHGNYIIEPHGFKIVKTGVSVEIPEGYMLLLKPKGKNNWLIGAGVVDAYYEPGEIMFKIFNIFDRPIAIKHGDPIGQGVFVKIATPEIVEVKELEAKSERSGKGGIVTQVTKAEAITEEELEDW